MGITKDGIVEVDPDDIIVFGDETLAKKPWRGGKYLFIPSIGDIFLMVFEPRDVLRWEIDRPMSLVRDFKLYASGEWFKSVRGEFGEMGAIAYITQLQISAQHFYGHIVEVNRRLKNGEPTVSRVVQKGR